MESMAPRKGVFHPKIWILRFVSEEDPSDISLRALILSRNLTFDRSWDLSLMLDGDIGSTPQKENEPLAELISRLPRMSVQKVSAEVRRRTLTFAQQVLNTKWQCPKGFDELKFHVMGLSGEPWIPPESDRLLIISPFLTDGALKSLANTSRDRVALISRSEEMDTLKEDTLHLFQECLEFQDVQDQGDDEDGVASNASNQGLHAKAYLCEVNSRTLLFVGSANATSAAVKTGRNIEILVELIGRTSQVGGIKSIFENDGLMSVLQKYDLQKDSVEIDPEVTAAENRLDELQQNLMAAKLSLRVRGEGDQWQLVLLSDRTIEFSGCKKVLIWPVTLPTNQAVKILELKKDKKVSIATCSMASLTQFTAFELVAEKDLARRQFVLNLPMEGLPDERDAAVTRSVVETKDGFLRYLLLILSEMVDITLKPTGPWEPGQVDPGSSRPTIRLDELPLLEELTRAYCRDPERIRSIEKLLTDLESTVDGQQVIPEGFHLIWGAFQDALGKR